MMDMTKRRRNIVLKLRSVLTAAALICTLLPALPAAASEAAAETAAKVSEAAAETVVEVSEAAAETPAGAEEAAAETTAAAADTAQGSVEAAEDAGAVIGESIVQTMDFTDVYGNVHTLTIDPTALTHDYNEEYFILLDPYMYYTDAANYTFRWGIDVSYYQGDIDWESVKAAGFEFVFIRVGYRGYGSRGSLVEDRKFRDNLAGAKAAGLDVGVYFFSQALDEAEAAEEAAFVLSLLGGETLELPIVYDFEFRMNSDGSRKPEARSSTLTGTQVSLNTIAFCSAVAAAGYEPAFYTNLVSESEVYNMTALSPYTVWYADYSAAPQTPYAFTFWQYSESGQIPGIEGNVDLNIQLIPVTQE